MVGDGRENENSPEREGGMGKENSRAMGGEMRRRNWAQSRGEREDGEGKIRPGEDGSRWKSTGEGNREKVVGE